LKSVRLTVLPLVLLADSRLSSAQGRGSIHLAHFYSFDVNTLSACFASRRGSLLRCVPTRHAILLQDKSHGRGRKPHWVVNACAPVRLVHAANWRSLVHVIHDTRGRSARGTESSGGGTLTLIG
jgi:hypothetical protein